MKVASGAVVHGTFAIVREYPHAVARVFAAWVDPAAKARWFAGPPDKWQLLERRMDVRAGGSERVRGKFQNGRVSDFRAHYHDVVPERRIVYAYDMFVDERKISVSLATITFEAAGKGTRLTVTEQGAFLDGYDDNGSREQGTAALMDALGKSLER